MLASSSECQLPRITLLAVSASLLSAVPAIFIRGLLALFDNLKRHFLVGNRFFQWIFKSAHRGDKHLGTRRYFSLGLRRGLCLLGVLGIRLLSFLFHPGSIMEKIFGNFTSFPRLRS